MFQVFPGAVSVTTGTWGKNTNPELHKHVLLSFVLTAVTLVSLCGGSRHVSPQIIDEGPTLRDCSTRSTITVGMQVSHQCARGSFLEWWKCSKSGLWGWFQSTKIIAHLKWMDLWHVSYTLTKLLKIKWEEKKKSWSKTWLKDCDNVLFYSEPRNELRISVPSAGPTGIHIFFHSASV